MAKFYEWNVAFVKADCETCQLVAPLLAQLVADGAVHKIVSQDAQVPGLPAYSITYDETLERMIRPALAGNSNLSTVV